MWQILSISSLIYRLPIKGDTMEPTSNNDLWIQNDIAYFENGFYFRGKNNCEYFRTRYYFPGSPRTDLSEIKEPPSDGLSSLLISSWQGTAASGNYLKTFYSLFWNEEVDDLFPLIPIRHFGLSLKVSNLLIKERALQDLGKNILNILTVSCWTGLDCFCM